MSYFGNIKFHNSQTIPTTMKIRQLLSPITIASLGLFGVSCKSTGTAKGGGDDGAYVGGYDSGNGEYDNVYEMGGSDDDSYSYETADNSSSSSSYNYESNDYSSSPAPSKPKYVPVPEPAYTPPPSKGERKVGSRRGLNWP